MIVHNKRAYYTTFLMFILPSWTRFRRRFSGWRLGVILIAMMMAIVLLINIIFLVWATSISVRLNQIGALHTGAGMLGGSNYTMQRLSAPTRVEVDKAHSEKRWLEIGIPSIRNIPYICWKRIFIWTLLALTSVPIQMLFNSAIFTQINYTEYGVFVIAEDFFKAPSPTPLSTIHFRHHGDSIPDRDWWSVLVNVTPRIKSIQRSFRNISNEECMKIYSKDYVTSYGDVLVVTKEPYNPSNFFFDFDGVGYSYSNNTSYSSLYTSFNSSGFFVNEIDFTESYNSTNGYLTQISNTTRAIYQSSSPPIFGYEARIGGNRNSFGWACYNSKDTCSLAEAQKRQPWRVMNYPISYCLVLPTKDKCKLLFSVNIFLIVISCNLVKLICMLMTVFLINDKTLVTVGDAISSFVQHQDKTTSDVCLLSISNLDQVWRSKTPMVYTKRSVFLNEAPRSWRWILCVLCSLLCIGTPICLLALNNVPLAYVKLGFGTVSAQTLLTLYEAQSNLIVSVLVSNTPQLLVSITYTVINAIYTCQSICREWSNFGQMPKRLRVTVPELGQSSSTFLGLPYIYSCSLLFMSTLLHWLISRSIFSVDLDPSFDPERSPIRQMFGAPSKSTIGVGYSPQAIIVTLSVGTAFLIFTVAWSFRRLPSGIPMASTCSAAISAACHPKPGEKPDIIFGPIKWGVVSEGNGVGHCAFSSGDVDLPIEGRLYQ